MSNLKLPPATLQRLIDFAHAAMEKRHGYPSDYVVTQSRRPEGHAVLTVEDLQAVQQLGKPSWDHSLKLPENAEFLKTLDDYGHNELTEWRVKVAKQCKDSIGGSKVCPITGRSFCATCGFGVGGPCYCDFSYG